MSLTGEPKSYKQLRTNGHAAPSIDHLEYLKSISPSEFEHACRELLEALGVDSVTVTGGTGDGGIDGTGYLTVGSLTKILIVFQAKRYGNKSVGSPEIRDLRGAMVGRTETGFFITTGTFTPSALEEANRQGAPPIELVDGPRLVQLRESKGLIWQTEEAKDSAEGKAAKGTPPPTGSMIPGPEEACDNGEPGTVGYGRTPSITDDQRENELERLEPTKGPNQTHGVVTVRTIVQNEAAAFQKGSPRDEWRYGFKLTILAVAAIVSLYLLIHSAKDSSSTIQKAEHAATQSSIEPIRKQDTNKKMLSREAAKLFSIAIRIGNIENLEKLVRNYGTEVRDSMGHTPLMVASYLGNLGSARLLLGKGASIDATNNDNETPLVLANRYGNSDVARLLIEHGANPDMGDKQPPRGSKKVNQKEAVNAVEASADSLIFPAVLGNDREALEKAVAKGGNVNFRTRSGVSPLMLACDSGYHTLVNYLVERGADVNARHYVSGDTPLILASRDGDIEIVRELVYHGADLNARDRGGRTALFRAAEKGRIAVLEHLLRNRAEVNVEDNRRRTPMAIARARGHEEACKILKAHGGK
ncbi:MAG: ankyrin repeat domain-containing protein [Pseudomonadota bacterium]